MPVPGALSLVKRLIGGIVMGEKADCLELGCGDGRRLRYLRMKYQGKVIGIESGTAQARAVLKKTRDCDIQLVIADSACLPFRRASFDVVMALGGLDAAVNLIASLDEMARVTRCTGYLLYADAVRRTEDGRGLTMSQIDEAEGLLKQHYEKLRSSLIRSLRGRYYHAVWQRGRDWG